MRPRPRERPRSLRRKDRGAGPAPRTQLLEGQAVERRHFSKRHSDKTGITCGDPPGRSLGVSHLPRTFSDQAARTPRPATPPRAYMPRPSDGLSPVNVASGPPLPGVMAMHGCSEENWPAGQGPRSLSPVGSFHERWIVGTIQMLFRRGGDRVLSPPPQMQGGPAARIIAALGAGCA